MFDFEKQPSEETTRAVSFARLAEIKRGESIVSATVDVLLAGAPTTGILVSHVVDSPVVMFRVRGGVVGQTYKITIQATTNAGHVREADGFMRIVER